MTRRNVTLGKGTRGFGQFENLIAIRNGLVKDDYDLVRSLAETTRPRVAALLAQQLVPHEREQLVADYFFLKVAVKAGNQSSRARASHPSVNMSVQTVVLDPSGGRLLLQRRGDYKRLYPGTLTVSANYKGDAPLREKAAASVASECGLQFDPSRFFFVGAPGEFHSDLMAVHFVAVTPAETRTLSAVLRECGAAANAANIALDYRPYKREITLHAVGDGRDPNCFRRLAGQIERLCGIPGIFALTQSNVMSFVGVRLQPDEFEAVRKTIERQRRDLAHAQHARSLDATQIDALDRDTMEFVNIAGLPERFSRNPRDFALDLTMPYFSSEEVLSRLTGDILPIRDPRCACVGIVGGKGTNTHRLGQLAAKEPQIRYPRTLVINTAAFNRYVLEDEECRSFITRLGMALTDQEAKDAAATLRARIEDIELPNDFAQHLECALKEFGDGVDVAVRSSATIEDTATDAAAGLATSFLHVTTTAGVVRAITRVWSSLYSDAFVAHHRKLGLDLGIARMAILIQPTVPATAAGAVFSIHEGTSRRVFTISAQPGLGLSVVDGSGQCDRWVLDLSAKEVLEEHVARKNIRTALREGGGVRREEIDDNAPCLSTDELLALCNTAKLIRDGFRAERFAEEIDIEFCCGPARELMIVQVRPKEVAILADGLKEKVTVVDEQMVRADIATIDLEDAAVVPCARAVCGRVQVILTEGIAATERIDSGVILVIAHTSNIWNGVFPRLMGLVCAEGGMNSHAALNAPKYGLGCIVRAPDTVQKLMEYDGRVITLDPARRRVYLGEAPVTEVTRHTGLWTKAPAEKPNSELLRTWVGNRAARPDVFIEDFDGAWRYRSQWLGWFQLDCYYQAWDRLTTYLNTRYAARRAWELKSPERDIRSFGSTRNRGKSLLTRMPVAECANVAKFLSSIDGFSLSDAIDLYNWRAEAFCKYESYMSAVECLTSANIEEVVARYVEILSVMHFAFWLNQLIELQFGFAQMRHVDAGFQELLRERAIQCISEKDNGLVFDKSHSNRVVQQSIVKEIELHALAEEIRSNASATEAFQELDPSAVSFRLQNVLSHVAERIERLSHKYKRSSEDIRLLSDTGGYVNDIREALANPQPVSLATLAHLWWDFAAKLEAAGKRPFSCDMLAEDPNLFFVLREAARCDLASRHAANGNAELHRQMRGSVTCSAAERHIGEVLNQIEEYERSVAERTPTIDEALKHFPNLKRIAALSKLELVLREDGHHRIVPQQRRLARLMLDAASMRSNILERPEEIFEVAAAEVIALFQEEDPSYVKATIDRCAMLEAAQRQLRADWCTNRETAIDEYCELCTTIDEILYQQRDAASVTIVKEAYENERSRLQERIRALRAAEGTCQC